SPVAVGLGGGPGGSVHVGGPPPPGGGAGGGRATSVDSPAQRLAREAVFLLIQGQTAPVREAHLAALASV
ncbi:hypothetical protein ACFWR9_21050, partial [Streptomyces sp. NPDC058534]